jgi:hypothetical protein
LLKCVVEILNSNVMLYRDSVVCGGGLSLSVSVNTRLYVETTKGWGKRVGRRLRTCMRGYLHIM